MDLLKKRTILRAQSLRRKPWKLEEALYAGAVATSNFYESERLLGEYLQFHYGEMTDSLAGEWLPAGPALENFPARCVSEGVDVVTLPPQASALDVGCAVGRATFELARHCETVVGLDFSHSFIHAAETLKREGSLAFERAEEGARTSHCVARIAPEIPRERASFETGDAMNLRANLGGFDVVLAANLMCRLRAPARFLHRLPELVKRGGQLVITTPCTWMEDFTPRENWLCDEHYSTLDGLRSQLDGAFDLVKARDLPFMIREHARKFQFTVAQMSVWRRR